MRHYLPKRSKPTIRHQRRRSSGIWRYPLLSSVVHGWSRRPACSLLHADSTPSFTTVFADALPPDYLVRLWDVFLFEGTHHLLILGCVPHCNYHIYAGVTFLFRAGLALFSCTRRFFLQSPSPEAVLDILSRPPPTVLPPSPDAFIELAFSVKLKDDDVRKQRGKLEAQVKRRTAQARASPISPAITPTISLPKNGL